jgi:hypothetical protein
MIQGITKQELIEILDDRIDKKLDEKLDEKLNVFAVVVNKSFQVIEDKIDKMITKEELKVVESRLESRMDKGFNKLDIKIDNYKGNTDRRIDWLTDEVIKLKRA